jgi:NifB/MoaA-like Fe-S oxidoreductase
MVRVMLDGWARTRRALTRRGFRAGGRHIVIASASLAAPLLREVAADLASITGAAIDVVPVTNTVFGERVNVSGLLCGQDFVKALAGRRPDCFILPRSSLDYFGRHFLDSMTIEAVEQQLGRPLTFASQWSEVVRILEKGPRRPGRNAALNGAFWSE